jgi:leucyl/phenylalanyl-tRNA---protein transferase
MRISIPFLGRDAHAPFPPVARALREPNGLLAAGGDLSLDRLLAAYREGIFPWFMPGEPLLWWSPDPRAIYDTGAMHRPARLRRWLRSSRWTVSADTAFAAVVTGCAAPRQGSDETWITHEMIEAYGALHAAGHAHSIEVRDGEELVGGLYGVAVGRMFCAESMFSARSNGSKVALLALAYRLAQWGWPTIDAQVASEHLFTLGARCVPRREFLLRLHALRDAPEAPGTWAERFGKLNASELAVA